MNLRCLRFFLNYVALVSFLYALYCNQTLGLRHNTKKYPQWDSTNITSRNRKVWFSNIRFYLFFVQFGKFKYYFLAIQMYCVIKTKNVNHDRLLFSVACRKGNPTVFDVIGDSNIRCNWRLFLMIFQNGDHCEPIGSETSIRLCTSIHSKVTPL